MASLRNPAMCKGATPSSSALLKSLALLCGQGSPVVRRRPGEPRACLALASCAGCARWAHAATVTLGNHDLHLLAVAYGCGRMRGDDTLADILSAPDRDALLKWLLHRPLLAEDLATLNLCLLHAGLSPQWDLRDSAQLRARIRAGAASGPRKALQTHVWGQAGSLGRRARSAGAPTLHRQLLHPPALRRPGWAIRSACQGGAEKGSARRTHSVVRGGRCPLAGDANRFRPLVDARFFHECGCDRPRHRLRLGRQLDRATSRPPPEPGNCKIGCGSRRADPDWPAGRAGDDHSRHERLPPV